MMMVMKMMTTMMMMTMEEMKPLPLLRKVRRKILRRYSLRSQVMKTQGRSTHLHHTATVVENASACRHQPIASCSRR
jgi:hypothetical protein